MTKQFSDLKHTIVPLKRGGEVIILDTGALIDTESEAMLQALHSRSTGGLRSHLEILAEKGSANFMKNFYVGFGHDSIGDCGSTTIFVEGVSMLAVKAVQDNPLYSGTESSTRYLDFSKQPFLDITDTREGRDLLEMQRRFYIRAQDPTKRSLKLLYPRGEGEKQSVYEKAIDARTFDITRSLLPAGASTNFSWHTNLRQAADKVLFLRHHPLLEVREIAEATLEALRIHHPNSFGHILSGEKEAYQDLIAKYYYYHDTNSPSEPAVYFNNINIAELEKNEELFKSRPEKTGLPKFLGQIGTLDIRYKLDFGSFRDIQRHRAVTQRMPLLTSNLGFNSWYLENFPEEVITALPSHLEEISNRIKELRLSQEEEQYFLPMGYNISGRFTGDLPSIVYLVELRNSRFVHPTLQKVAGSIVDKVKENLGIRLNVDPEPNRFDVKRGEQDITKK